MAATLGRKMFAAAALTMALAACDGEPGPGGVTAEEAEQLNEAADMIDVSSDSLSAGDDETLGNGEEPIAEESDTPIAEESETPSAGNGVAAQ